MYISQIQIQSFLNLKRKKKERKNSEQRRIIFSYYKTQNSGTRFNQCNNFESLEKKKKINKKERKKEKERAVHRIDHKIRRNIVSVRGRSRKKTGERRPMTERIDKKWSPVSPQAKNNP